MAFKNAILRRIEKQHRKNSHRNETLPGNVERSAETAINVAGYAGAADNVGRNSLPTANPRV